VRRDPLNCVEQPAKSGHDGENAGDGCFWGIPGGRAGIRCGFSALVDLRLALRTRFCRVSGFARCWWPTDCGGGGWSSGFVYFDSRSREWARRLRSSQRAIWLFRACIGMSGIQCILQCRLRFSVRHCCSGTWPYSNMARWSGCCFMRSFWPMKSRFSETVLGRSTSCFVPRCRGGFPALDRGDVVLNSKRSKKVMFPKTRVYKITRRVCGTIGRGRNQSSHKRTSGRSESEIRMRVFNNLR
jgi:hypothetical protein